MENMFAEKAVKLSRLPAFRAEHFPYSALIRGSISPTLQPESSKNSALAKSRMTKPSSAAGGIQKATSFSKNCSTRKRLTQSGPATSAQSMLEKSSSRRRTRARAIRIRAATSIRTKSQARFAGS